MFLRAETLSSEAFIIFIVLNTKKPVCKSTQTGFETFSDLYFRILYPICIK